MTVIAWDGRTLAVDSATTSGQVKQVCTKWRQTRKRGQVVVMAAYGALTQGLRLMDWYVAGADPAAYPAAADQEEWAGLIVLTKRTGKKAGLTVVEYEAGERTPGAPIQGKQAWGSGREVALGAMHVGARAQQAAEAACDLIASCGGPVHTWTL
jgi:hypothetical protein